MKKVKFLLSLFMVSLFITGCSKKTEVESQKESTAGAKTNVVETKIIEEAKKQKYASGIVIYTGWVFYEQRADEKMYAVMEASAGERINFYVNDNNEVEQKIAVRHLSDGKEDKFNFVHVVYEGKEYWTRDIFVADKAATTPAVLLKEDYIYSGPDILQLTKTKIEAGTYFAIFGGITEEFVHAIIYNGTPFGKEVYLKATNVEADPTTMEMIKTLEKLNKDTPKAVVEEILQTILDEWLVGRPDSKVSLAGNLYFRDFMNQVQAGTKKVSVPEECFVKVQNRYNGEISE